MHAGDMTRVAAGVAALAAGVAALVVVALLLSNTPGPVEAAPLASAAPVGTPPSRVPDAFPAPPARTVVFARADGSNVLALAAGPRGRALLLQASVLDTQGKGVEGLDVSFTL